MRQRTRWRHSVLGVGDRTRLDRADPYRQVAFPVLLLQQENGLLRGHLHADAHDGHSVHRALTAPIRRRPALVLGLEGTDTAASKLHAAEARQKPRRLVPSEPLPQRRPSRDFTSAACNRTNSAASSLAASSARAASSAPRCRRSGVTTCSTRSTARSAALPKPRRWRASMPNAASSAAIRATSNASSSKLALPGRGLTRPYASSVSRSSADSPLVSSSSSLENRVRVASTNDSGPGRAAPAGGGGPPDLTSGTPSPSSTAVSCSRITRSGR